jgi:hypothetical protein
MNKSHINNCGDFTTSQKAALLKTFEELAGGAGGGEPAGGDKELQLNDNGSFGGSRLFVTVDGSLGVDLVNLAPDSDAAAFGAVLPETQIAYTAVGNPYQTIIVGGDGCLWQVSSSAAGFYAGDSASGTLHSIGVTPGTFGGPQMNYVADGVAGSVTCGRNSTSISFLPEGAEEALSFSLSDGVEGGSAYLDTPRFAVACPITPQWYTVANLPANMSVGAIAYATDGRKSGETAGNGTGCPVYWNGLVGSQAAWCTFYDNTEVQA